MYQVIKYDDFWNEVQSKEDYLKDGFSFLGKLNDIPGYEYCDDSLIIIKKGAVQQDYEHVLVLKEKHGGYYNYGSIPACFCCKEETLSDLKRITTTLVGKAHSMFSECSSNMKLEIVLARFVHYCALHTVFSMMELPKLFYLHGLDEIFVQFLYEDEYCRRFSFRVNGLRYTAMSTATHTTTEINYSYVNGEVAKGFVEEDLKAYVSRFVHIHSIVSTGDGLKVLKKFFGELSQVLIVFEAGYLFAGDYEEARNGNQMFLELPEKLASLYESIGAVNVNDKIGNCEESICMIYCAGVKEWKKPLVRTDSTIIVDDDELFNLYVDGITVQVYLVEEDDHKMVVKSTKTGDLISVDKISGYTKNITTGISYTEVKCLNKVLEHSKMKGMKAVNAF